MAAEWDRLADRGDGPLARHGWFSLWWKSFGEGAICACIVREGQELRAAIPLARTRGRLMALASNASPRFRPLADDEQALAMLMRALVEAAPGELILHGLPADDRAVSITVDAAKASHRLVAIDPGNRPPRVDLTGSWEDYRSQMKSKWGSGSIERKERKMARGHRLEMRLAEPPRDFEEQVRRGFALESQGWKGARGTAILSSRDTAGFYWDAARFLHDAGALRLSEILLDGELIAFDMSLLWDGDLLCLKTAYDERYATLSPGMVLRRALVQRCFELGLRTHDLGGDDTEWKRRFATSWHPQVTLCVYRIRPVTLAHYVHRRHLRHRVRRVYTATLGPWRVAWAKRRSRARLP